MTKWIVSSALQFSTRNKDYGCICALPVPACCAKHCRTADGPGSGVVTVTGSVMTVWAATRNDPDPSTGSTFIEMIPIHNMCLAARGKPNPICIK